jgi:3-phenylpropionate/trans-cinnamate dioxygenase ferredoxin subunit
MITWHKIEGVSFSGMEEGKLSEVVVASKRIGLLKRQQSAYAFSATCPHAGIALCGGWLDGQGRIVCPEHKYRFDPANGRNTSGEGYKLVTYPLEVRGDELYVGLIGQPA